MLCVPILKRMKHPFLKLGNVANEQFLAKFSFAG